MPIEMNIYVTEGFFESPNQGALSESPSEALSREILSCVLQIDYGDTRKGDPRKKEPDCMLVDGTGIEVVWGENQKQLRQLDGSETPTGIGISALDFELTIKERIESKAIKKRNGLYDGAEKVSLCCVLVTPVISWYFTSDDYQNCSAGAFFDSYAIERRELFWEAIYAQYIESGVFENIHIICPTHDGKYACFDIRGYHEDKSWLTIIGCEGAQCLPFCELVNKSQPITWKSQLACHIIQVNKN